MKRRFEWYAEMYTLSVIIFKKVAEKKISLWWVFVTAECSRRQNKTTTMMNFCWLKFFNTCAAPASVRVHRFGCGFLLWLTFFTEQVPDTAFNLIRHTLCGELTTKLENIWWSIMIFLERISPRFFQRWSMQMSCLRMWAIIQPGFNDFGYIYSWYRWMNIAKRLLLSKNKQNSWFCFLYKLYQYKVGYYKNDGNKIWVFWVVTFKLS